MQAHPLLLELSAAQQHLLQLIWEPMRDENRWPIWDHVENGMYDAGFTNAELALRSMPTVGALTAADPHYSLVWYDHWNLNPKSTVRLTIAAALHLDEYRAVADNFIDALQALVRKAAQHRTSPFEVTEPEFTSAELKMVNIHFTDEFIRAFPRLVRYEPFGLARATWMPPGSEEWFMPLKRRVLRKYAGITTVEEYVRKVVELVELCTTAAAPATSPIGVTGLNELTGPVSGTAVQVNSVHGDVIIHPVASPPSDDSQ